ncbi:type I restriction-modification system subunit M [Lactococcus insecticola]|uniref:site-specific DNA-methyltransferase (adenine-specific) n=1 Tax=Pseudolactococcus insecticola TaxID=2709158 RepID=A0A6A0B7E7_9LACT|nr:type I restriction-modification system subunit M [Lactococcus insecticola]GFH40593.1 type I restriction-modification system subunit M [Lactococcus insecticola]
MAENATATKTLETALWNAADVLRSKMDANEYKDYLLGLIFYKYLSDQLLAEANDLLEETPADIFEAQTNYETAYADLDIQSDLIDGLKDQLSYILKPDLTFAALVNKINASEFQLEDLAQGFADIERASADFAGLFEDIDLYSRKLGTNLNKQNQTIADVMKTIAPLDVISTSGDTLGDAYEYLIGQFASESGKKAGEFYTPQPVAHLMMQAVLHGKADQKGFSVYDPTMGSGSLLLNAKKYSNEPATINYFGQELNTSTFNLARMNMLLHGVQTGNQFLRNGDTLDGDWPVEEPTNFDAVLMNPPYSAKWRADAGFLQDPRFSTYGVIAPKSKADYAFLLHGYYHLKDSGTMAIVLPHGILFRGAAEGKIRTKLLEMGAIDTVIGLPANIFYNTSIPTTIVILKKNRSNKDVFFIDASKEFVKGKNQNTMTDAHLQKILDTYFAKKDVDKLAHLASFDEIRENDFNLNIPRYVDTFEAEAPIDLAKVGQDLLDVDAEIAAVKADLLNQVNELVSADGHDTNLANFKAWLGQ